MQNVHAPSGISRGFELIDIQRGRCDSGRHADTRVQTKRIRRMRHQRQARNGFDQERVRPPASIVEKPEALAMARAWGCQLCLSPIPDNNDYMDRYKNQNTAIFAV
jgi:hypothetical protein